MKTKPQAMKLEHVWTKFKLRHKSGTPGEFYAIKDLSLELDSGEVLGIIGKNGAGKSTLLKTIAGILVPSRGTVTVNGKIAPLIELGASFIPDLSGLDNVFFSGGIFGYSRSRVEVKVDKIVEFSGLREFITQPVKTYSTGMYARLAFATMLFFDPDIALIDEVFAVGDENFQKKSMNKIFEFRQKGKTVLIASHNLALVESFATRVIVLDEGRVVFDGKPEAASDFYLNRLTTVENSTTVVTADTARWGNKKIEIKDFCLLDAVGNRSRVFDKNSVMEIRVTYKMNQRQDFCLGLAIKSSNDFLLCGPNIKLACDQLQDEGSVSYVIPQLPFNEGEFNVDLAIYDTDLVEACEHINNALHFTVRKHTLRDMGFFDLAGEWRIGEGACG